MENRKTKIYVGDKKFRTCTYLLFTLDTSNMEQYKHFASINDAIKVLDNSAEKNKSILDPETEFWGHCSNLQVWAEQDYDTHLLDYRLSFGLLKALAETGDPKAKKVFKEEIARRYRDSPSLRKYICNLGYLDDFSKEELDSLGVRVLFLKGWNHYYDEDNGYLDLGNMKPHDLSFLEEIKIWNIRKLHLNGNKLHAIPSIIGEFSTLEELDLSVNHLEALPESIGNLTNLRVLKLARNKLTKLPESIGNLRKLQELSVYDNYLKKLPESIDNLQELRYFYAQSNFLETLPKSMGTIKSLESIYLGDNMLAEIPESLENLPNLRMFDIANNDVAQLPAEIANSGALIYNCTMNYQKNKEERIKLFTKMRKNPL